jgi:hypothetical protein
VKRDGVDFSRKWISFERYDRTTTEITAGVVDSPRPVTVTITLGDFYPLSDSGGSVGSRADFISASHGLH